MLNGLCQVNVPISVRGVTAVRHEPWFTPGSVSLFQSELVMVLLSVCVCVFEFDTFTVDSSKLSRVLVRGSEKEDFL